MNFKTAILGWAAVMGLSAVYAQPKALDTYYSIDKNHLYFDGEEVKDIDLKTYRIISPEKHLARDAQYLYFETNRMDDADPETFRILNSWFWKDKNHVYFLSTAFYPDVLIGADPATFEVLDDEHARDRGRAYDVTLLLNEVDSGDDEGE